MGHAGAIISGSAGTAPPEKMKVFEEERGIAVAPVAPRDIVWNLIPQPPWATEAGCGPDLTP